MRRAVTVLVVTALAALGLGACGDDGGGSGDGEERTVLVDFRHDEFASAFFQYYPEKLQIRPGDTIQFRQAWTGEPHSVTFGRVVDGFIEQFPAFERYESVEDAIAGGVPQADIDRFLDVYTRLPAMTDGYTPVPAGAEPCFVDDLEDAPLIRDPQTDEVLRDAECTAAQKRRPAFDGRQAVYNSGFIPYSGEAGNRFTMPIAADAEPGTYRYFCNYHFVFMSGSIEIVEPGTDIPSQAEVSRRAREEIAADAAVARPAVEAARKLDVGQEVDGVTLPLAGRSTPEEAPVIVNEFLPRKIETQVGQKVTWTFDGYSHTVSFNVPKYFPIFTVADDGTVHWDPKSYEPVGFDVPRQQTFRQEQEPPPVHADAGRWDGRGGFRSSGALNPGDTFSVTFTRAGTYSYACVLHPQMVGTVTVRA